MANVYSIFEKSFIEKIKLKLKKIKVKKILKDKLNINYEVLIYNDIYAMYDYSNMDNIIGIVSKII